jgi:putative transposase
VDRSTYHYRSRRAGQAELTERIREIAAIRVRYGYRRIRVLLRREGFIVNHKRLFRIYREERLMVRKRGGRKGHVVDDVEDAEAPSVGKLVMNEVHALGLASTRIGARVPHGLTASPPLADGEPFLPIKSIDPG